MDRRCWVWADLQWMHVDTEGETELHKELQGPHPYYCLMVLIAASKSSVLSSPQTYYIIKIPLSQLLQNN